MPTAGSVGGIPLPQCRPITSTPPVSAPANAPRPATTSNTSDQPVGNKSRTGALCDLSPSVRLRRAGARDRRAVGRARRQVRAPRSRPHGRSRGVRDDGHPRASRLRRSPSDPWRRGGVVSLDPRRRDDRHLVKTRRDPRRHIETRVGIAFELETIERASSRASDVKNNRRTPAGSACVPVRNPFEGAIVGQGLKQPSVCREETIERGAAREAHRGEPRAVERPAGRAPGNRRRELGEWGDLEDATSTVTSRLRSLSYCTATIVRPSG